jgi:hypothetical protein
MLKQTLLTKLEEIKRILLAVLRELARLLEAMLFSPSNRYYTKNGRLTEEADMLESILSDIKTEIKSYKSVIDSIKASRCFKHITYAGIMSLHPLFIKELSHYRFMAGLDRADQILKEIQTFYLQKIQEIQDMRSSSEIVVDKKLPPGFSIKLHSYLKNNNKLL